MTRPGQSSLAAELHEVMAGEPVNLARAALVIAKLEYPDLDPTPTLQMLDTLGERAAMRLAPLGDTPIRQRIAALNHVLYDEERFAGNRRLYSDFRNSLLNVVIERRLGIPISLALVYLEVARRAGITVFGVAFPGHFLLRVASDVGDDMPIILDPFDRGRELNENECRRLLALQAGDAEAFDPILLSPCTSRQFVARMLNNLKRIYVESRSFSHAHSSTDLLLAVEPSLDAEIRDRGLLAYHLDNFPAALRDLEHYLRVRQWTNADRDERERIKDHVDALRRRTAGLN